MSQYLLAFDKETVFGSLFIKIKTVTEYPSVLDFKDNDESGYRLFLSQFKIEDESDFEKLESIYQNSAVFSPEFSKIVTIAFGFYVIDEEQSMVKKELKTIMKENELDTIKVFWKLLDRFYRSNKNKILVGHNLTTYDIPFYCKRLFKHKDSLTIVDNDNNEQKIGIPDIIKKMLIAKPWEQLVLDTAEVGRFGGFGKPNLDNLAFLTDFKRDVNEIPNESINKFYWESENKIEAMKEISFVAKTDVEIMMDFVTEMRRL